MEFNWNGLKFMEINLNYWQWIEITGNGLQLLEIVMGVGGLELGSCSEMWAKTKIQYPD